MNVEQYLEQRLAIGDQYMMGDDMPLDSNCGHACKLAIDAAHDLINQMDEAKEIYDCDAQYAFKGHVYSAFREDFGHMECLNDQPDQADIKQIVIEICHCYIFG